MTPEAVIAHESPGRLRVKIPAFRGDVAQLTACGERFGTCPGVMTVNVNPLTGSVLILHETQTAEIVEFARSNNIFSLEMRLATRNRKSPPLEKSMKESFKKFDGQIKQLTEGEMDLRGFAFAALAISGIIQITRGNAGALPWHAAFWYAFNIFPRSKEEMKEPGNDREQKNIES